MPHYTRIEHSSHPNWRGGRIMSNGRWYIYVEDEDGQRGYQLEHRIIMAEHLGRPLDRSEFVRHIDGDILNNETSNLEIITGPRPENMLDFECDQCGKHVVRPITNKTRRKNNFCSMECYHSFKRRKNK